MLKNKMAYKMTAGYTVIVLITTLILGIFFISIFRDHTFENKQNGMLNRAKEIAKVSEPYLLEKMDSKGFYNFLNTADYFINARVWIVDSRGNIVVRTKDKLCSTDKQPNSADGIESNMVTINKVLKGEEVIKEDNSQYYNESMIMVGVPIKNESQEVIGAVLLYSPIIGITSIIDKVFVLLIGAIILAVGLTGVLSFYYSRLITRPIKLIKNSAIEMTDGNYKVRTSVHQKDEIGQLASSLDLLASKLDYTIDQLLREEQMRKDFIANVSHELRTPLTLIRGSTEALIDGTITSTDEILKHYNNILQETKGMERLVSDLLDLSKLQSGKTNLHFEKLDMRDIITDVARNMQQIANKKAIKIERHFNEEEIIPLVSGDYHRLRQLLIIFIDNAIKYSNENSMVSISLDVRDIIYITIQDEGVGIPKEEIPHIWERFYKVDKSRKKSDTSTGLGLSIAKYLIGLHKGTVKIESEPGKGTIVKIGLPFVKG